MDQNTKTMTNPSIEERVKRIVCNQMGTSPDKITN
jgi:hypothetical protein